MNIRKFTAVLSIAIISASSLSPVYADMREDKLNQREKMLTERALILSDKSVNLDDKEQELSRRAAELDELSKTIQGRSIEFSVREIELDEIKASLNKDSALLASQNMKLASDRIEFESYKAEVEKRAENAERIVKEADEKLKSVEERGNLLAKREKAITEREEEVAQEISRITVAKADLLRLDTLSRDVAVKIAQLDNQQKSLESAQSIYKQEKAKLDADIRKFEQDKASVATLKEERDNALAEAKKIRAESETLSERINEYISLTAKQEETIASLSADLAAKNDELLAATNQTVSMKNSMLVVLLKNIKSNAVLTEPKNANGITTNGIINWSDGSVRAIGRGFPPENIKEEGRMEILAQRAAMLDLQRNLLETVKGVQVESRTKVSQLALDYDVVETKVSGLIKGVEVVSENWNPEKRIYTVAGQIRKDYFKDTMLEVAKHVSIGKNPNMYKTRTSKKGRDTNSEDYTGLILDVRHLGVDQQKFFHVVDEKGNSVYGTEHADKNIQARDGLFVYFRRIVLASDEKSRVGDNPLVIKAQRVAGNGEDIVIPNSEADKIRRNKTDFRKDCRVIIVMS